MFSEPDVVVQLLHGLAHHGEHALDEAVAEPEGRGGEGVRDVGSAGGVVVGGEGRIQGGGNQIESLGNVGTQNTGYKFAEIKKISIKIQTKSGPEICRVPEVWENFKSRSCFLLV